MPKLGGRGQSRYQNPRVRAGDCVMENGRHGCVIVTAMKHRVGRRSGAVAGDEIMVTNGVMTGDGDVDGGKFKVQRSLVQGKGVKVTTDSTFDLLLMCYSLNLPFPNPQSKARYHNSPSPTVVLKSILLSSSHLSFHSFKPDIFQPFP